LAIAGGVSDARRIQRAQRAYRRGLVGRDLGPQQVRNSDGGDNQNNGHDDEKFDQREALLFVPHFMFSLDEKSCFLGPVNLNSTGYK
jgi:hypothetical protein